MQESTTKATGLHDVFIDEIRSVIIMMLGPGREA
jgi:hypothetical protein